MKRLLCILLALVMVLVMDSHTVHSLVVDSSANGWRNELWQYIHTTT